MIRPHKLLKLVEQNVNNKKGVRGYREQFRDLLGLTENRHGEPTIDLSRRELHPKDFSLQEMAMEFLGRNWRDTVRDFSLGSSGPIGLMRLQEADGHVVLPSHFANIAAFTDSVSGLIDAMVLEAYMDPVYIGDMVMETVPTRVNGGKMIGVRNDGNTGEDVLDSEPLPAVGLEETYVDLPNNQRRGSLIQVHQNVFLYDRTDQVQSMSENAGTATRRKKEIRQADYVLGIVNNYSRDGSSANTYLATAGSSPNDYVNSSANSLDDWTDIDEAINLLEGNTDPNSGFSIAINPPYDLLVMPQEYMNTTTIVRSTSIDVRDSGGTGTADDQQVRTAANPLPQLNLIRANREWYRRLVLATASGGAGLSEDAAKARWHLGHFRKAFGYRQLTPYRSQDYPITAEEGRRGIVLVKTVEEQGTPFVKEPRYAYQGTIGGV